MAKPAIPHVDPLKKHVGGNKSKPAIALSDARFRRHLLKEHISGSKSKPGISHVDAWLVLMCCDVMGDHYDDLCVPPPVACGIERSHGERLVLMCCAAPDVCPERVLLESSVYMGNGEWLVDV